MPVRLAMVCEAEADFRTASRLAERVLLESVEWLEADHLAGCPIWALSRDGRPFLLWRDLKHFGIKVHGHFDDRPAEPNARAARRALLVLHQINRNPPLDGIILVRDDDRDIRRRAGLEQARDQSPLSNRIVIGLAHCNRESWVLAGFEPANEAEAEKLAAASSKLGFDPTTSAHELTAKGDSDKRSAKRVIAMRLGLDPERQSRCVEQTSLTLLRDRGGQTGLKDYLDQIRERLVPLFNKT